jgi:dihydroorotase
MSNLIVEGKIINHDGESFGQVVINQDTGLIEEVNDKTGGADITIPNCLIFPGFGDLHIHMREDQSGKWNYKEDFVTASQAAIHGGVAFGLDLTNGFLPLTTEEVYLERKKLAAEKSLVDIVLAANIGPGTKPFSFPVPYKIFMGQSTGPLFFESKQQLEQTIKNYQGQTINFHCEDPEILTAHANAPTHEQRRPAEAEIKGIEFALEIIEKYQLSGKICHVSTHAGLEKIVAAKKRGATVTCETTPHHLYFDTSMLNDENHKWLQVNPPIRNADDRQAMIEGLKRGDIDFLASDHAPHTKEEKLAGASGMPHLDTYGAFTTWLMSDQGFTPQDIARICSYNPGNYLGKFLNIETENPEGLERFRTSTGQRPGAGGPSDNPSGFSGRGFGRIAPGYVGSLTIIDPTQKTQVLEANLKTKCGWSPFTGRTFAGLVKYAIIRGRVYENTNPQN